MRMAISGFGLADVIAVAPDSGWLWLALGATTPGDISISGFGLVGVLVASACTGVCCWAGCGSGFHWTVASS